MWNKFEKAADDILRQVVCTCGNYRHHGVDWMPEGSGEGKFVAVEILKQLVKGDSEMNKGYPPDTQEQQDRRDSPYAGYTVTELQGKPPVNNICKEQPIKSRERREKPPLGPIVKYDEAPSYDKNTPSSLTQLRWAIYEVVDNCHARTSSYELNMKIEGLFKKYTEGLFKKYTDS